MSARKDLFADLGPSEIDGRMNDLEGIHDFLDDLLAQSERTDSRRLLKRSIYQLQAMIRLLPGSFTLPPRTDARPAEAAPDSDVVEAVRGQVEAVRGQVEAEQVADKLSLALQLVRNNVLESWKLDESFEVAYLKAVSEKERFEKSTQEVKGIFLSGAISAATTGVMSLLIAFLALVIADFLQSQLDIARDMSAAVVGQTPEGPEGAEGVE